MRVLMPVPASDFDPTETAVPWRVSSDAGHEVVFATPDGEPAEADERMLTAKGLGPWRFLRARADARELYDQMTRAPEFSNPLAWEDVCPDDFDALLLPGGHAPGMKPYLESSHIQDLAVACFRDERPVGAICHGVLVLARAIDAENGASVLHGRRTTALPASMELSAWMLTGLWLGRYYRTYDETVEAEVREALGEDGTFESGPPSLLRDAPHKLSRGFTVRDGHYISARWPGDAYRFSTGFVGMLE